MVELGRHIVFWEMVFGNFMISRPRLQSLVGICSHENVTRRDYISNEPVGKRQRRNASGSQVFGGSLESP